MREKKKKHNEMNYLFLLSNFQHVLHHSAHRRVRARRPCQFQLELAQPAQPSLLTVTAPAAIAEKMTRCCRVPCCNCRGRPGSLLPGETATTVDDGAEEKNQGKKRKGSDSYQNKISQTAVRAVTETILGGNPPYFRSCVESHNIYSYCILFCFYTLL